MLSVWLANVYFLMKNINLGDLGKHLSYNITTVFTPIKVKPQKIYTTIEKAILCLFSFGITLFGVWPLLEGIRYLKYD